MGFGGRLMTKFEDSPCGSCSDHCCEKFFIILEGVNDKDWIKWLSYHKGVKIKRLDSKNIQVWFDYPCEHLKPDRSCGIYMKRPGVCRKFECPYKEKGK